MIDTTLISYFVAILAEFLTALGLIIMKMGLTKSDKKMNNWTYIIGFTIMALS